jgi:hypothetical protein
VALAFELLRDAVNRGYGCGHALAYDPWLAEIRKRSGYRSLLQAACGIEAKSRRAFRNAGGERLLAEVKGGEGAVKSVAV